MAARATVEALLRERKLDRTLTSAIPERLGEESVSPLDINALDRGLAGGLPRGQVSEVVGPASSGRTSLVWAALGAATRRGESVALIDTFDRFDPPTAHASGIELSRVLWVRGQAVSKTTGALDPAWLPGVRAVNGPGTFVERVIDRALKALNLVVQSGVCTLVVIDLIDVPAPALRRLPAATWFRIERAIEGSDTAVVLLAAMPVARSSGGRSIVMSRDSGTESSQSVPGPLEDGLDPGSRTPDSGPRPAPSLVEGTPPPGSPLPSPGFRLPTLGSRIPDPGSRSPAPGVIWKGNHDRTRRLGGIRATAAISAARWSHIERVIVETTLVNAVRRAMASAVAFSSKGDGSSSRPEGDGFSHPEGDGFSRRL